MSFNETVELERSLLRSLTKSMMMCRKYAQTVREEWFSSEERRFIFKVMMENFRASKSILTSTILEYEVDKRIDDNEKKHYIGEWNFIEAVTLTDPPEALIDLIREAHTGRLMMEEIEKVVLKAEEGNIVEAVSLFKQAAVSMNIGKINQPIVEITDYEHRKKLIEDKRAHPEKYLGIKTGFPTFDKRTGGLFAGELTLIAGVTGLGKSTLIKQLQKGIISQNENKNVLHIANEESQLQVETKFDALFSEIPYLDFKLATISDADLQRWEDTMADLKKPGVGRVFVKEVPAFTDVTLVEQAYRELEAKGIPIHVIMIDHLPHIVPIMKSWGENDEKSKAATDCKQLSKDLNCSVIIPTQAATEVEAKQSKGRRAGKLDVYGSKGQVHVANSFYIITDKGKVPDDNLEEWQRDVNWLVDCKKNRDGPGFCFRARHYVQFGKVEEVFDQDSQEDNEEHSVSDDEADALKEAIQEAEGAIDKPVDKPVEEPVVRSVKRPMGRPVDKPVDKPMERPVDKPVEEPVVRSVKRPMGRPVDKPVEKSIKRPMGRPVEKPIERPVDRPVGAFAKVVARKLKNPTSE
jgi:replicative DNA helicase